MADTPEGRVKAKVKALLYEHGAQQFWPVQTGYGESFLDCVGCHRGMYFAIETKAPGQHITPRQELTKDKIEAAGGMVFIIGEERMTPHMEYSGMLALEAWLLLHS